MKKTVSALAILLLLCISVSAGFLRGDIDGDGERKAKDYILLKRGILQTYTLSEEQKARADVNRDGKLSSADYIMLKRHILGTYRIPDEESGKSENSETVDLPIVVF